MKDTIELQIFKTSGKWSHDEEFSIEGLQDFELGYELSKVIDKGMYGYGETRNEVPFLAIGNKVI